MIKCAACNDALGFYSEQQYLYVAPCEKCMKDELQNGIKLAKSEVVLSGEEK